jgi:hypothetical protein
MSMEKKLVLSDFVNGERFELNSYLDYLFSQFDADEQDQSKGNLLNNRLLPQ